MTNGIVYNTAPNTTQPLQPNQLKDYDANQTSGFFETIFMVPVGQALQTKKDQLLNTSTGPEVQQNTPNSLSSVIDPRKGNTNPTIEQMMNKTTGSGNPYASGGGDPYGLIYYTRGACRDTSLGGNDALNCYWQYNENDDIAHPYTALDLEDNTTRGSPHLYISMGRVYAETINSIQSILYLGFGVPDFNNLSSWQDNFYQAPYAEGITKGWWSKGVDFLVSGWQVPFRAMRAIAEYYKVQADGEVDAPVTNFFAFRSTMPLYFAQVQSLLIILCTNMELMDGIIPSDRADVLNTAQIQSLMATPQKPGDGGIPEYITRYNLDFIKIMLKKAAYEQGDMSLIEKVNSWQALSELSTWEQAQDGSQTAIKGDSSTQTVGNKATLAQAILTLKQKGKAWFWPLTLSQEAPTALMSMRSEFLFIGFRIERANNSAEALSSSTQPSSLQQALNLILGESKNVHQSTDNGNAGLTADLIVGLQNKLGMMGMLASKFKALTSGSGVAAAIGAGISMADIPESWGDSQFSKSYSFNLQLIAPYGDPVTILQTLYMPLCCLLAGSAPRSTGLSTYTSPFYCRAYCKGKFAIPMGMIDSLSIDRGSSTHGWTHAQLPRTIDISFSIKDLTPNMPLTLITANLPLKHPLSPTGWVKKSLANGEFAINYVTRADTTLNQYLMTLAGFGPREFLIPSLKYRQRLKQLFLIEQEVFRSPFLLGMNFGNGVFNKLYNIGKYVLTGGNAEINQQESDSGAIG